MKKLLVLTLAFAFLLSGTAAFAQSATSTGSTAVDSYMNQLQILRNLRQGMSGEDVKILQQTLAAQPDVYPEGVVSGYYGPLTTKAVKKYQEKFGISIVGNVGPMTKKKLNEFIAFNMMGTSTVGMMGSTTPWMMGTSTATSTTDCPRIPPGHLIAPGWIKHHGGVAPVAPACQKLPPGIAMKLHIGTTTATTTPPTPPTDIVAPTISNIAATSTTASSTQISWGTSELATTKLIYGTTNPVLSGTSTAVTTSGLSFGHNVTLSNLTASTTYYYVVVAADGAGNTATSTQASFMTLGQ